MAKNNNNFRDIHNDLVDITEHVATYGLDGLTDQELVYAKKLVDSCNLYIETFETEDIALQESEESDE
jgi:predicted component of type VI protein secretion system